MSGSGHANDSVLANLERSLLVYIAERLPLGVSPDHLTIFGLLGAFIAFSAYVATCFSPLFLFVASLGLFLNWVGDSLDGTLARIRNLERPRYGFFVDHSADLISQLLIGIGFGLTPYVSLSSALLALCGYLAFVAHTFIRAKIFNVVRIAYFSVGPTETRLLLIFTNIILFIFPDLAAPLPSIKFSLVNAVCTMLAVFSFIVLLLQIYTDFRRLRHEERSGVTSNSEAV